MHNRHDRTGQLASGLILILIGFLFLLDHLNVISFKFAIRQFWPVFLIAVGVARLMKNMGWQRNIGERQ
jgi:hypothetical protein